MFAGAWNAAALGYAEAPAHAVVDPEERRWGVFAPAPRATDARFVVTGRQVTGEQVTISRWNAVAWDRSSDALDVGHRWHLYRLEPREPATAEFRTPFGNYLRDRWGERRDGDLARLTVTAVERSVRPGDAGEVRRVDPPEHAR